jgi:hypothetical protein
MINNDTLLSDRRLDERLSLSRHGNSVCTECKTTIEGNEYIWYNTFKRTVRHWKCPVVDTDIQERN